MKSGRNEKKQEWEKSEDINNIRSVLWGCGEKSHFDSKQSNFIGDKPQLRVSPTYDWFE